MLLYHRCQADTDSRIGNILRPASETITPEQLILSVPQHEAWFEEALAFIKTDSPLHTGQSTTVSDAPALLLASGSEELGVSSQPMKDNFEHMLVKADDECPSWDKVDIDPQVKTRFKNKILLSMTQNGRHNLRFPCIVLHGTPGNGKTIMVHSLCKLLDLPLIAIDVSTIVNMYRGETGK